MKYYQVTEEPKGGEIYLHSLNYWHSLVKGELYTAKELKKLNINPCSKFFTPVEVSRRKIYWFFGARFAVN